MCLAAREVKTVDIMGFTSDRFCAIRPHSLVPTSSSAEIGR